VRFLALFLFLWFLSIAARAEMIFVDLNDAPEEINKCREGIEAKNAKGLWQKPDQLHVVRGAKGSKNYRSNTYHALRAKIADLVRRKVPVDSIVISGDDGSGNFFGSEGEFTQRELKALLDEFPTVGASLKTAALWGCYPTSVHGAEQFWINKLPNMQLTMGFTAQGPEKSRPANHILLKQFCERREEAAKAITMDQLCKFHDSLQQLTRTSLGICNRIGTASVEYARNGEKCFTYQQLHERCPQYTNNPKLMEVYEKYMSGEAEPPEEVPGRTSDLRKFYNETQLWYHCASKFKHQRGFDIPYPPHVIRLIKYNKVKANLMKLNKGELESYDKSLERAGLGALKLGDITKLSRKELNQRIEAAVSALQGRNVEVPASQPVSAAKAPRRATAGTGAFMFDPEEVETPARPVAQRPQTVRAAKDPTLLRMAQCVRMTLVNLDPACTAFNLVGDRPRTESTCLMNYNEAQERHEDDAC